MALREQMENTGGWLFRWRSYLPLAMGAALLVAMAQYTYPLGSHTLDTIWDIGCLAVAFLGLALRAFTVAHAPKGTSGRNTKAQIADELNTSGMYSVVRHPLYLGNFIIWLAISVFPQEVWYALLSLAAFFFYYERIMLAEESFLRKRYGRTFEEWAAQTPAFIPNPRLWQPPQLPASWKTVLRREYSGFFGVIAMFTLLEVLATYRGEHVWRLDVGWLLLFLLGFGVFVVLRTLKKLHRLDVPGR